MFKVIFFFKRAQQGWSETYYTASGSLQQAFASAYQLAQVRAALLASPASLDYIRVSSETDFRTSLLTAVGASTPYPLPETTWTSNADKVETAALMRAANFTLGYSRNTALRGNPDNLFDNANPSNADAQLWLSKFTNGFVPRLQDGSYNIKGRPRPIIGVNTWPISNMVPDVGQGSMTVTLVGNPAITENSFVDFYRVRGARPQLGRQKVLFTILAGGNRSFRIPYYTNPSFSYLGGGFIVLYAASYPAIQTVTYVRAVSRKTGRPFGVARGRRPVNR